MKIRRIAPLALLAAAALASMPSQSATSPQNFNVSLTVQPVCQISSLPTLTFGTYTAFQTSALTPGSASTITVQCNSGFSYNLTLADSAGANTATVTQNYTDDTSNGSGGVPTGLTYSLTITGGGTAGSQNAGSNAGDITTASVSGSIAANQRGTCGTTGACTNTNSRTVFINY